MYSERLIGLSERLEFEVARLPVCQAVLAISSTALLEYAPRDITTMPHNVVLVAGLFRVRCLGPRFARASQDPRMLSSAG